MYKKVGELNLPKTEEAVLKFWKENDVKQKCLNANKNGKMFSFYEGPPTANGEPHAGHVLTRTLKDCFTRAKAQSGYYVPRKGGWDTHGLPVEISVEKEIGISGKEQIEEYGIENFINKCKENVWKYADLWKNFSNRVGYFVNMEDDYYVTYHDDYIESVWWSLKELDKKGLLYKGYKILPSCPHCGTSLSSHELAQGYKDRTDLTCVAKFKSVDEENTYFLAWTTTPWTLPSNIALCVNANEDYVKLSANGENYILAKALVNAHFKEGEFEIVSEFKGKDLEFKKYEPLFSFASPTQKENGYYVTCDDYVTLTDGTGIVHIAPAYGEDDSNVGRKYNLPFLQFTNKYGTFTENCGKYAGLNCFDTNAQIAQDLREEGKLFKQAKHSHNYPHCWRCGSPLIYFARESWFVKVTAIKDQLIKNNQSVNWIPETIKDGRMGNWLENAIDWGISRDRYWGTPLPVWKCECGHYHVVGSKAELKELAHITGDIELHKPYVDEVEIKCPTCGKMMKREPEVIDCWYDSGSMPFAQFHYPFENKEEFEKRFPAEFISEGVDQCRGWFYTLQVLGTALFGKSPYKNVIANGLVVDEKGNKLSKSLGNYTPPMDLINDVGADAVRWTFYTEGQPYANLGMTPAIARESYKTYFGSLWNTYAFFTLYADIDNFDPSTINIRDCKLNVMDEWILSEYNKLEKYVKAELDQFHCTEPARAMQKFVDDLSNWYVRRSRKRFWVGGFNEDKQAAYATLWYVLTNYAMLSAPFTPFISEEIYQNLYRPFFKDAPVSIHLTVKEENNASVNEQLNKDMELTYAYTELGRSARNLSNLKIRQPLAKLYLTDAQNQTMLGEDFVNILKEELNVKEVVQNANLDEFVNYSLKPQLKTLGPKYGSSLGAIRAFLETCNAGEVVSTVRSGKPFVVTLNDKEIELNESDLLISVNQKEGYASATENGLAVIFDTHLTEELINEGIMREFISKVQALRKSSKLEVVDRIHIEISGNEKVKNIILNYSDLISADVLALSIKQGTNGTFSEECDLNGEMLTVKITKA